MTRGRMLSRSLSQSEKFAALPQQAGHLAEFCQCLYCLLIVHADDCGRFDGDPQIIKLLVHPSSSRTVDEFAQALTALRHVGLLVGYEVRGHGYYYIQDFEQHQLLRFPPSSDFPAPTNGSTYGTSTEEKRREEKRSTGREEKNPPVPPLSKGGLTLPDRGKAQRAELRHAAYLRREIYLGCPHTPKCPTYASCLDAIARELRTGERSR